jgi:hypothetical protein
MKKTAKIVGSLFLTAMAASLIGGDIVESASAGSPLLIAGIILELVNAAAVVAIAVLMFPVLKKQNKVMAAGYLGFRLIEAVFCALITASPFSLLLEMKADAGLSELRSTSVDLLIPIFFCAGAFLFYTLLYKSTLVPRFISVWGILAAISVLVMNLLSTFQLLNSEEISMILALPIIINEIFLGIWLIVKGFNPVTKLSSHL